MKIKDKAKRADGLMKHLRTHCQIAISGGKEKKELIQYGYYHGYKGYRFFKRSGNKIPYTKFSEIIAVIDYDHELKQMIYPVIMFVEMATKNIVLEQIVPGMKDASVDNIYKMKMSDESTNSKLRLQRLCMRDKIHTMLSNSYRHKNSMVSHFYNQGLEIPIWVVFEIIMLGDFAEFIQCLDKENREKIATALSMRKSYDTNCQLVSNVLWTIKELRNATAHNNVVFDTRFQDRKVNKNIITWVKQETSLNNVNFDCFTDYIALLLCLLKCVQYPKKKMLKFLNNYKEVINSLYEQLPLPIYNKVVATGIQSKLKKLEIYIRKIE